jgi:inhibitor of KinA
VLDFSPLGDRGVTITLGASINEAVHLRVRATTARIDVEGLPWLVDRVPGFASVTVHYEPAALERPGATPYDAVVRELTALLSSLSDDALPDPRTIVIPVCYGADLGPDLADVANRHDLTPDDVIQIHAGAAYLVYMIGFMPGFAYLGGLDDSIVTPRRPAPRTEVPAGSVGIGGNQTGVYPTVSPGGWNLIGRTPLKIFDIRRLEPALLAAGDQVRFRAITRDEYDRWPP